MAADNVVVLAPAGTDNNAKCINTESSYVDLCPSLKSVTSILSNALCDLDGCSLFDKTTYERIAAVFGIDKEGRHFKEAMSCDDLFEGAHHMLLSKCMLTRDDGISSVPSVNNLVILFVEGMNRAEVTRCLCCASCYDSSGVIAPGSISAESFKVGLSLDSLQVQKCPQPLGVEGNGREPPQDHVAVREKRRKGQNERRAAGEVIEGKESASGQARVSMDLQQSPIQGNVTNAKKNEIAKYLQF